LASASSPGAEVLRREAVAETVADVLVQKRAGQVHELALALEPKEPRSAGELEQRLELARQ
jgi:hypothetical protein